MRESIEVEAPLRGVSQCWSDFEKVRVVDRDTSHWTVKGPLGKSVEFDAKTTEMGPSRGIG